jgi:hypothetical protein
MLTEFKNDLLVFWPIAIILVGTTPSPIAIGFARLSSQFADDRQSATPHLVR